MMVPFFDLDRIGFDSPRPRATGPAGSLQRPPGSPAGRPDPGRRMGASGMALTDLAPGAVGGSRGLPGVDGPQPRRFDRPRGELVADPAPQRVHQVLVRVLRVRRLVPPLAAAYQSHGAGSGATAGRRDRSSRSIRRRIVPSPIAAGPLQ